MKSAQSGDHPFLFSLEMDQWNHCAPGTRFKKKELHQVAFTLLIIMQIGPGITETWIQCHPRAMWQQVHSQTHPPRSSNTCRIPFLRLAKNILVKIEKDFPTKISGGSHDTPSKSLCRQLSTMIILPESSRATISGGFSVFLKIIQHCHHVVRAGRAPRDSQGQANTSNTSARSSHAARKKGNCILRTESLCRETNSNCGPG